MLRLYGLRRIPLWIALGGLLLSLLLLHDTPSASARETRVSLSSASAVGLVAPPAVPAFGHVYLIVMENQEYGSIVGSASATYLNSLAAKYGLATNYFSVTHPSQPNYLALFSGSTQGVGDDGSHLLVAPSLADQLDASGKGWRLFSQNVPPGCFTGGSSQGGEDGDGVYDASHNPAISFASIRGSALRCAHIADFSHFDPNAAAFEFISPNMCNNMHDCSVATGDGFLAGFVPAILGSAGWQSGGVLFITWDEGTSGAGGGGHVPLFVISNRVTPGFRSAVAHNHYSLVHTIENAFGLGCLALACSANDLSEFFH